MCANRTPVQPEGAFPFDVSFQMSLLRLLCEDEGFAHALGRYLQPVYFENEVLAWAYSYSQRHVEQYGAMPSLGVILQKTRTMDSRVAPVYELTIQEVMHAPLRDEVWIKDSVLDFVQRNMFARSHMETRELYNSGKFREAYDLNMRLSEEIQGVSWETPDAEWVAEGFSARQVRRTFEDPSESTVPTGFNWLDHILNGGLSLGELGIWIAGSKVGKTTMLLQHGKAAARDGIFGVAHFVFEGSRKQVVTRYDSCFSGELYNKVKSGNMSPATYQQAVGHYSLMAGRLYVQGFTERWDYTAQDIHETLKGLRRKYGFIPKLVIVDYGDLLTGRDKRYRNDYEKQKAAFRDLKSLANRGYAVWTASQTQRPKEGADDRVELVKSRQIADAYDKVRVADFIGSLNQTREEKESRVMRLYAEMYRDNAADRWIVVEADMDRMMIRQKDGLVSPSKQAGPLDSALGYVPPKQIYAPI